MEINYQRNISKPIACSYFPTDAKGSGSQQSVLLPQKTVTAKALLNELKLLLLLLLFDYYFFFD